jgi:hypothetical protein
LLLPCTRLNAAWRGTLVGVPAFFVAAAVLYSPSYLCTALLNNDNMPVSPFVLYLCFAVCTYAARAACGRTGAILGCACLSRMPLRTSSLYASPLYLFLPHHLLAHATATCTSRPASPHLPRACLSAFLRLCILRTSTHLFLHDKINVAHRASGIIAGIAARSQKVARRACAHLRAITPMRWRVNVARSWRGLRRASTWRRGVAGKAYRIGTRAVRAGIALAHSPRAARMPALPRCLFALCLAAYNINAPSLHRHSSAAVLSIALASRLSPTRIAPPRARCASRSRA